MSVGFQGSTKDSFSGDHEFLCQIYEKDLAADKAAASGSDILNSASAKDRKSHDLRSRSLSSFVCHFSR